MQLIEKGLSNLDIAQQLFLALSTVKGHNRNIFDKLQVHVCQYRAPVILMPKCRIGGCQ
ncbi:LuxR C-terminal-related transcriptional regulator [Brevibacillus brevis]|nr:LuxR C-terminal-related transcriptional regulator [Brevibacillus brevis]